MKYRIEKGQSFRVGQEIRLKKANNWKEALKIVAEQMGLIILTILIYFILLVF